jgi:hypothetical protein
MPRSGSGGGSVTLTSLPPAVTAVSARGLPARAAFTARTYPLGPSPAISEREDVDHHLIAWSEVGDIISDRPHHAGRLNAQSAGQSETAGPGAGPHEVVPVAYARGSDVDKQLVMFRISGRQLPCS